MVRMLSVLLTVLVLASGAEAAGEERSALKDALVLQAAFQEAIQKAEPSVVCILVWRANPLPNLRQENAAAVPEAYGSGVVLGVRDDLGLILTNEHVVRNSKSIYVRLPSGKRCHADIYNRDSRSDLAILKLREHWPVQAIKLGDGDHVRKGQLVLSLANPYAAGFADGSPSASWGIISNIRRRAPGKPRQDERDVAKATLHHYGTLLQTDARLNLGCSGGALIDLKGELIGLTTAQAAITGSETAGGFAIPMNTRMKAIVQRLREGREVEYGFLGVQFMNPYAAPWQGEGVEVTVVPGSPLSQALGRAYARSVVIQEVDGIPVHDNDDLLYAVGAHLAGTKIKVKTRDAGAPTTVTLAKNDVPGPVTAPVRPPFVHGVRVDYTSVLYIRTRLPDGIPQGVFISEVEPGSGAEKKQLKDAIITHVNGQPVRTPAEFYRIVAQKPGPIRLQLNHGESVELN